MFLALDAKQYHWHAYYFTEYNGRFSFYDRKKMLEIVCKVQKSKYASILSMMAKSQSCSLFFLASMMIAASEQTLKILSSALNNVYICL